MQCVSKVISIARCRTLTMWGSVGVLELLGTVFGSSRSGCVYLRFGVQSKGKRYPLV